MGGVMHAFQRKRQARTPAGCSRIVLMLDSELVNGFACGLSLSGKSAWVFYRGLDEILRHDPFYRPMNGMFAVRVG